MKNLSLLTALMLSSSMVYAGWTRYEFDPATGVYKTAPKYSCLEMICEHDCVENDDGQGECCEAPKAGTDCRADVYKDGCLTETKKECSVGQYCSDKGECVCPVSETLPVNACYDAVNHPAMGACPAYVTYTTKACTCSEGYSTVACASGQTEAAKETLADGTICYQCQEAPTCVHLYQYKGTRKQGQGKDLGCCEGNLISATTNVSFSGYKQEEDTKYGCCPKERTIETKSGKKTVQSCCAENKKSIGSTCCEPDKIYVENGVEKCCNKGTVYSNGTKCCADTVYDNGTKCCTDLPKISLRRAGKNFSWTNDTACGYWITQSDKEGCFPGVSYEGKVDEKQVWKGGMPCKLSATVAADGIKIEPGQTYTITCRPGHPCASENKDFIFKVIPY